LLLLASTATNYRFLLVEPFFAAQSGGNMYKRITATAFGLIVMTTVAIFAGDAGFAGSAKSFAAGAFLQDDKPVYTTYKGVQIGMPMADARTKLGTRKDESDAEDYFEFSETESARVFYDEAKKVKAISVTYIGNLTAAPAPRAVVGEDIQPKPDGGMYRMMQYPKNGFWVSYVKLAGTDPMVIITIQKMTT
jgi:hypothetical protein